MSPVVEAHDAEAFVLVGGAGRRLGGRDKGLIRVNGAPLVRSITSLLSDVSHHVTLLGPPEGSKGYERRRRSHLRALSEGGPLDCSVSWRPDLPSRSGSGALRALESAFSYAESRWVWVVSVDLPLLSLELLRGLMSGVSGERLGHMYTHEGRLHPLLSLWARSASEHLRPLWERGGSLQQLSEAEWLQLSRPQRPEGLLNLNTPAEMNLLRALRPSWRIS